MTLTHWIIFAADVAIILLVCKIALREAKDNKDYRDNIKRAEIEGRVIRK
jgi:hypothetical protein